MSLTLEFGIVAIETSCIYNSNKSSKLLLIPHSMVQDETKWDGTTPSYVQTHWIYQLCFFVRNIWQFRRSKQYCHHQFEISTKTNLHTHYFFKIQIKSLRYKSYIFAYHMHNRCTTLYHVIELSVVAWNERIITVKSTYIWIDIIIGEHNKDWQKRKQEYFEWQYIFKMSRDKNRILFVLLVYSCNLQNLFCLNDTWHLQQEICYVTGLHFHMSKIIAALFLLLAYQMMFAHPWCL